MLHSLLRRRAPCQFALERGCALPWRRPLSGGAGARPLRRLLPPPARALPLPPRRLLSSNTQRQRSDDGSSGRNASLAAGMFAVALGAVGLSYAAVPLYRMFCQATGFGGTTRRHDAKDDDGGYNLPADPSALPGNRTLKITFNTDVDGELPWSFKPVQNHVSVLAGQTCLAFFEATNHSTEPIIGVATYNVAPMKAGAYFNKIQCFCFEEQRLGGREEIDMPVFFYIDPEIVDDPAMQNVQNITLSYTFFKTGQEDDEEEEVQGQRQ